MSRRPGSSPALHQLLVDAARLAPESIAVLDLDQAGQPMARSYRQLLARTERFATALTDAGLRPADRVIVDAVNCATGIAMLMACSMVGVTFIPLSPEVPDQRAGQIVRLSRPQGYLQLPGTGRLDRLAEAAELPMTELAIAELAIAELEFDWAAEPILHRTVPGRSSQGRSSQPAGWLAADIAYLIFTSGSTGEPKGVAMSQQATSAFFAGTRGLLRASDRVASTAPLQFDFCLLDIGACLANRCTIVPIPRDRLRWPRQLVSMLRATDSTRVHAVPSAWRPLLRRQPELLATLPPLAAVMYTGEPFPPAELADLRRHLPDTRVINCYGPTECMACSFTDVTDFVDGSRTGMPVDGSYPGSTLCIVDEQGRRIEEPDRPGQLRFTGPSVFTGYWSPDAELHRPSTVHRPAGEQPSLLTGDYAHYGPDRRLYLDGRRDRQVKVAGNRVELAEIEATLSAVPGVEEARIVVQHRDDAVRLIAFVAGPTAGKGKQDRVRACQRRSVARLPHYMRPARVIELGQLPKNASGKVDQQELAQLAARL